VSAHVLYCLFLNHSQKEVEIHYEYFEWKPNDSCLQDLWQHPALIDHLLSMTVLSVVRLEYVQESAGVTS
jgi:hypothetical protein